jgi:hypothetical protein
MSFIPSRQSEQQIPAQKLETFGVPSIEPVSNAYTQRTRLHAREFGSKIGRESSHPLTSAADTLGAKNSNETTPPTEARIVSLKLSKKLNSSLADELEYLFT